MSHSTVRLVWATDIHLDHADPDRAMAFFDAVKASGPVELAAGVGLVGHGGWGDVRNGNRENSKVMLMDYFVISDLKEVYDTANDDMTLRPQHALKEKLRSLGREAAECLRPQLSEAVARFRQVIVLTHVPPFPEAAWHQGAPSSNDWLPGFSCRALGEELYRVAGENPDTEFTVLCGHTHGEGVARIRPNLVVHTQGVEYGDPDFRIVMADRESVNVEAAPHPF